MQDTAQTLPPSAPRTRALLVDDSRDVTGALARFVAMHADLECVGELDCAEGLVEEVVQRRPDVVVLDLTMPGSCPLGTIRALAARVPSCRVIAHSGYDDPNTREEARRAGAWELVGKRDPADLLVVIRRAAQSAPSARPASALPLF